MDYNVHTINNAHDFFIIVGIIVMAQALTMLFVSACRGCDIFDNDLKRTVHQPAFRSATEMIFYLILFGFVYGLGFIHLLSILVVHLGVFAIYSTALYNADKWSPYVNHPKVVGFLLYLIMELLMLIGFTTVIACELYLVR